MQDNTPQKKIAPAGTGAEKTFNTPIITNNMDNMQPLIKFGVIRATDDRQGTQKKAYLDQDGKLVTEAIGNLYDAEYRTTTISSMRDYAEFLKRIHTREIVTIGVSDKYDRAPLKKAADVKAGEIARSKKYLTQPEISLCLLDIDDKWTRPDENWDKDTIQQLLIKLIPGFENVARVLSASNSSWIYDANGNLIKGDGNYHITIAIKGDLQRLKDWLVTAFWLRGYAWYSFGSIDKQTGVRKALERFPIDMAVFSAERPIYEAGAHCTQGLYQQRPDPTYIDGGILDVDALPAWSEADKHQAQLNRSRAKAEITKTQLTETEKYRVNVLGESPDVAKVRAKVATAQAKKGQLEPDHILYGMHGDTYRAGDLTLSHVNLKLRDPHEPDYRNGAQVAIVKASDDGNLFIYSQAHGGQFFTVAKDNTSTDASDNTITQPVKPDKTINMRYLDAADIVLQPGLITMVSSACNTGKTTSIFDSINNFAASRIVIPGYRNALGKQTAAKWDIQHVSEADHSDIPPLMSVALCVNSLLRIRLDSIRAREVWVLDECVAVINHLLTESTLGKRQGQIIEHFIACIKQVIAHGGSVVCLEDSIPQYFVDVFDKLMGDDWTAAREIITNEARPQGYDVIVGNGQSEGFYGAILDDLSLGKKSIVVTDSQAQGEALEIATLNAHPHKNVLRIDRTTKDEKTTQDFMVDPDSVLRAGDYDLVILSPTGESGVSITHPGFDTVYGYFGGTINTRAQIQMLERYRLPVPRNVYCKNYNREDNGSDKADAIFDKHLNAYMDTIDATNATEVYQAFADKAEHIETQNEYHKQIHRIERSFTETAVNVNFASAILEYADTVYKGRLLKNLITELQRRGNNVAATQWGKHAVAKSMFEVAEEQRIYNRTNEFDEADVFADVDLAHRILECETVSRANLISAKKTILIKETLPGVEGCIDREFIAEVVVKNKLRQISRVEAGLALEDPRIAQVQDLRKLQGDGVTVYHTTSNKYNQTLYRIMIGLTKPVDGEIYTSEHPVLVEIYNKAFATRHEYERTFKRKFKRVTEAVRDESGKLITPAYTLFMWWRDHMFELGYKFSCVKRGANEGKRLREYVCSNINDRNRETIEHGLANKWDEYLTKHTQQGLQRGASTQLFDLINTTNSVDGLLKTTATEWKNSQKSEQILVDCTIDYGDKTEKLELQLA